MHFSTIASGSSGNAYYLGIGGENILIDAGISGKKLEHALQKMNITRLSGIFITHEHRDHITGAGYIARRFNAPIYAAPLTWRYLLYNRLVGKLKPEQIKKVEPNKLHKIGGAEFYAFDVMHDAIQPVGYAFRNPKTSCEKFVIATDLGCATPAVIQRLKGARVLVLESNHDNDMLERGRYPARLKVRVSGNQGHLSNAQAGMLLAQVATTDTHVVLAHLSEENNTPMLAFETVSRVLDCNNIKVKSIEVAERHVPGVMAHYE